LAAVGGGDVVVVESVGDRGQGLAGCSLASDPLDHVGGDGWRPAEADALAAFAGERLPCPLGDQAPLEGGEGGDQARVRAGGWRCGGAVERDERPALRLRGGEQGGEVEQQLGQRGAQAFDPSPGSLLNTRPCQS
jgi:hypothetical protein